MTTIYVRTTGNDTTGTGATGTPYLTVSKALSAAVAGDVILIGDGTYAENTSALGYLSIGTAYASYVTLAPESGLPDKVTITGSGTAWGLIFGNAAKYRFDALTFQAPASSAQAAVRFAGPNASALHFTRCTFIGYSTSGSTNQCVATAWTSTTTANDITFVLCKFKQIGIYSVAGAIMDATVGGASNIEFRECSFETAGAGLRIRGITNARILGNTVDSWGEITGVHPLEFGVDGPTGQLVSGIVAGNTFRTFAGHATVIGAGANGVLVTGNRFFGGNNASVGQGLVIKEAQNVLVEKNTISGGALSGLYFKAAVDCQAFDNVVYNDFATAAALKVDINSEDSLPCRRITVRQNRFVVPSGTLFSWAAVAGDAGGSVCDENVYVLQGSATLGTVRGTPVATLSQLLAAWSGYDKANNDRNSRIGATRAPFAGTPLATLPA